MEVRKILCPACGVNLRVAASIPVGKRIKCPKCAEAFPVPDDIDDEAPVPEAITARPRKAAPRDEDEEENEAPAPVRSRRSARPRDEDEEFDDEEERPAPRKLRKKKKKQAASNLPLILGLSIGGVLILSAGVLLAVFRPWEAKTDQVAASNPTKANSPPPRSEQREREVDPRSMDKRLAGQQPPAGGLASGGKAQLIAAGKQVYESMDCNRCHSMTGKGKGPALGRVGANPRNTVERLSAFIANPRAERPRSRMPGYEEKLSPEELRNLAEYLTSLK
jgi:mono/diheme cytochrome c family protein